ncbi:hypothetical protein [Labedella endophytica]|uniref:Uncharacterized protein n=1 Tax=Labedella endophytica TaxID=1523160 RepID=A0A3S0VQQ9_9MICO|nr:hypothetical protein [Labedella endophytica]RUQ96904.1 hypothetical protein ELQ94_16785 [Labedella endophytica]
MPSRYTRSERRTLGGLGAYAAVLWIVRIVLYVDLAPDGVGRFFCFMLLWLATVPFIVFRGFLKRRATADARVRGGDPE